MTPCVCVTAQHRQMLDQVLSLFGIVPDADLNLMQPNQTLGEFTCRAISALDSFLAKEKPDLVLVQGDTTTVFCAALISFYHRIPVGHVEAGLRTGNLQSPWPEEANRVLTSRLTTLHFAPVETASLNLQREGTPPEQIFVTGNTVIDALLWVKKKLWSRKHVDRRMVDALQIDFEFAGRFFSPVSKHDGTNHVAKLILVTAHRRESFGAAFERVCHAIRELVERHPELGVIYPVHLNPNVQEPVRRILANHPRIQLIEPVGYEAFVWLMSWAHFILTDSGGVQEEAPTLGKPVLVLRDTTERPEGVQVGTSVLVGTLKHRIIEESERLLQDQQEYARRSRLKNPYGDGKAAERILSACEQFLV